MVILRRLALASVLAVAPTALACSSTSSSPSDAQPPDAGGCAATRDSSPPIDACECAPPDTGTRRDATKPPLADCSAPEASTASLSSLRVTSASDPSVKLVPDFAPDIYDYYVQCGGGTNSLSVSVKPASGASSSLSLESPGGARTPATSTTLNVDDNQAIIATVTEGKTSQEYWVRCLPQGFPPLQWTPHADGCARPPGYYLIGTMSSGTPGWVIVLDTHGVPVWYHDAGGAVYDVETLLPGDLSFSAGGWHFDQLSPWMTSYPAGNMCPGPYCGSPDEHELRVLPNGHYLGISSAEQSGVDLTGVSVPGPDGGPYTWGSDANIYACDIFEFDSAGTIYWSWKATDHFDAAKVWTYRVAGLAESEAEPFHCNAIDFDPLTAPNYNLLVSARHMDSIFYIERPSGKVLWKLGGANSSKDDATYVPFEDPVEGPFYRQHDARLQPGWKETCAGGSGRISLFDDETDVDAGGMSVPARAALYDVTIAGACDGGAGTGGTTGAALIWKYENWQKWTSGATGGFRIDADGSHIIGWGQSEPGGSTLLFTEVDEKGNDLLDLIASDGSSSYRAVKVPIGAFDLSVLRNTSGM
jgi:hypothetical protein